jgi:transposase
VERRITDVGADMSYPSDLTDEQWKIIEPLLPAPRERGNPRKYAKRDILNGIFYVCKTGCQWRYLPHDLPPWKTVYRYFQELTDKKIFEKINTALVQLTRTKAGRNPTPSLVCIDSQSVKGDVNCVDKGIDGNKKVVGRKRHIVTDVLGLVLFCVVTAANVADIGPGKDFVEVISDIGTVKKILVDRGYQGLSSPDTGLRIDITSKDPTIAGFVPVFKRWVVERTFAWLSRQRRLAKDYERNSGNQEAMVYIAMTRIMLSRIA